MDTSLVLYEAVLLEVVGLLGLVSIPDLPVSACKAVIAEDLDLAFLQNSVLSNLVFAKAGNSTKLQLKVKAVLREGKANPMRKTEKRFVESENLQDLADQIVEMENLVWVAEIAVCLVGGDNLEEQTCYQAVIVVGQDCSLCTIAEEHNLAWMALEGG